MPYLCLEVGELQTNCYAFYSASSRECFVIDPGDEAQRILGLIAEEKLAPRAVILTHGHPDHFGAAPSLMARFRIPLWLHAADEAELRSEWACGMAGLFGVELPPAADRLLADGDRLELADQELRVVHSPGHSMGSILLHGDGLLFTGDTLFRGDVGRTDLPGGDEEELRRSLAKIREFPAATIILPGHGESSVLGQELKDNPYL